MADYTNGAYVLLNDEQTAFHVAHPEASQMEVYNMQLCFLLMEDVPMEEMRPVIIGIMGNMMAVVTMVVSVLIMEMAVVAVSHAMVLLVNFLKEVEAEVIKGV